MLISVSAFMFQRLACVREYTCVKQFLLELEFSLHLGEDWSSLSKVNVLSFSCDSTDQWFYFEFL